MLHEILLSLSGVSSPIWDDLRNGKAYQNDHELSLGSLTSPAEKAMVEVMAELADLHIKVRNATSLLCVSHSSPVCRAISNRIQTFHLRSFVEHVLRVETSILNHDATYVGAYNIVPLSTIVSEFQPWARPLRWLWKIVQSLRPPHIKSTPPVSGADALRILHTRTSTGYADIKSIAEDLLVVGQKAWTQNLMPWVLYGRTPSFGADDFMVQVRHPGTDCYLRTDLIPYFVTADAAETILAIGLALQQIVPRAGLGRQAHATTSTCSSLMPASLQRINSLQYPIQSIDISKVVKSINDTISHAALSVILPQKDIFELLLVLQEYVVLRNGEFSSCLIRQADDLLLKRQDSISTTKPVRKLGRLDDLNIGEAETISVLEKTWSDLSAFVSDNDSEIQLRDRAADLIRLEKCPTSTPICTLLPNSAGLTIKLPLDSPLKIFISTSDIETYQMISVYLISIRRAEFQLTKLWRESSYRRCYPTPIGPPTSATKAGQQSLLARRTREDSRNSQLRQHWACISQVLFLISELGNYFHGEVIQKSWECLCAWLDLRSDNPAISSGISSRPTTSQSASKQQHANERSVASTSNQAQEQTNLKTTDPRTISLAHQAYLKTLSHNLLLHNKPYTSLLSTLLTSTDHYVALFHRLKAIWAAIDFESSSPSPAANAFSNHTQEETELLSEMKRTNENVTGVVRDLIRAIRDLEEQRDLPDLRSGMATLNLSGSSGGMRMGSGNDDKIPFEPWRARTLDRLLMKLDSLVGDERSELYEDALVDIDDDDDDDG